MRKYILALILGAFAVFGLAGTGVAQASYATSGTCSMFVSQLAFNWSVFAWNGSGVLSCPQGHISAVGHIQQINIAGFDRSVYYANTSSNLSFQGSLSTNAAYAGGVVNNTFSFGGYWPTGCPGNSSSGGNWTGTYSWTQHIMYQVAFSDGSNTSYLWSGDGAPNWGSCAA